MGMMISTPKARVTRMISQKATPDSARHSQMTISTVKMPRPRLSKCCMGKTIGRPLMMPCSLRKAITEPVKVMAPIETPTDISIRELSLIAPGAPMP